MLPSPLAVVVVINSEKSGVCCLGLVSKLQGSVRPPSERLPLQIKAVGEAHAARIPSS